MINLTTRGPLYICHIVFPVDPEQLKNVRGHVSRDDERNETCLLKLTWDAPDSGKCLTVYEIEILEGKNDVVPLTPTIEVFDMASVGRRCYPTSLYRNISRVRVRVNTTQRFSTWQSAKLFYGPLEKDSEWFVGLF